MRIMERGPLPHRIARNAFFARLSQHGVPLRAIRVLDQSGARQAVDALSLLAAFPVLTERGHINAAELSDLISRLDGNAARSFAKSIAEETNPEDITFGASAPPGGHWQDGDVVPADDAIGEGEIHDANNLAVPRCNPWPVRNQDKRGTCVSFAATAVLEVQLCQQGNPVDLSEQFLYWAIKTQTRDPHKNQDGTSLEYARDGLASHGICTEVHWPYVGQIIPNNISHAAPGVPAAAATADGLGRTFPGLRYQRHRANGGGAAMVLNEVRAGRPVAITVPVFWDPQTRRNNWSTPTGFSYGFVADPPPSSIASGGHAVCVVGFAPDPNEPLGGYFVIRNSWDSLWGTNLPDARYAAPEAGYGQISMSYIEKFLWETSTF